MRRSSRAVASGTTWLGLVYSDLRRFELDEEPSLILFTKVALAEPGFLASAIVRGVQTVNLRGWHRSASVLRHAALTVSGLDFMPGAQVGPGLRIHHPQGIVIGSGAIIGADCTLFQNVTLGEQGAGRPPHEYPRLGTGVTIGSGACVLGGIQVGDGSVIGANSVVLNDVPARSVAVGAPARVLFAKRGEKQDKHVPDGS